MAANKSMISYDPAGVFIEPGGISAEELAELAPALDKQRRVVLDDAKQFAAGKASKNKKQPLDVAFFQLPEQLLDEYRQDRSGSELGRILEMARYLSEQVDRVVVLGIGGSYMGARALMEACCPPYWNELTRADRGSRPRMYFEGNNVDNDATQALLGMLKSKDRPPAEVADRWGIVVISKSGGTIETAIAFRQFYTALLEAHNNDLAQVAPLIIPVTGAEGRLHDLANKLGCPRRFPVPEGVGGRFSVLSAVGLVPAAILGLDVVALLEGAAEMNEHFRSAPPDENMVLQYVGISHLMEYRRSATLRMLTVWSKALEAVGFWYDQLLSESLGKDEKGATPVTVVNTRDLHSRAQQHQEGRRDKLFTNVIVDNWRSDPLPVGRSEFDEDKLNEIADRTLPEIMNAAITATNQALHGDDRPTADIHLPQLDERHLGQLFQMLMLATVVEGQLLGINPYGQPGVQKYKRIMDKLLGRS